MLIRFIMAIAVACASVPVHAESYPSKPVRIVVPYSAGGTTDFVARQVAQTLTEATGKSFFVENKPGASGTIGTVQVARAAPDGYTLLANDTTYTMLPSLFKACRGTTRRIWCLSRPSRRRQSFSSFPLARSSRTCSN